MSNLKGVRALVTGHTGFKGAWLCAWLEAEGAEVAGFALAPETDRPNLFTDLKPKMASTIGDIRDLAAVRACVDAFKPEIVFHLAAQALVRRSYADPLETFATNVMGTAHVLEAARACPSVRAIVCVTSDKCYENDERERPFRETDPLGGKDPYSASKGAAEIVAGSYARALYPLEGRIRMATARGGNVIGGGDWSEDRIVPDIARAVLTKASLVLRNPGAIRPWQHVLELVRGYVQLGTRLLDGDASAEGAWNFGPRRENEITVGDLVARIVAAWGAKLDVRVEPSPLKEANVLKLDITKAEAELGWSPKLSLDETMRLTAEWYCAYARDRAYATALTRKQLAAYM